MFVNERDLSSRGLKHGDLVDITVVPDEKSKPGKRVMHNLTAVAYNIAQGSIAAYYPEANVLVALDHYDVKSGTPSYKSTPVLIRASGNQVRTPNIIGFVGWSGSGKTTLITRLIPVLTARGISVSTIKHAHHGFDIDKPGKDSYAHRSAGATEVLVTSGNRWALVHELRGHPEPDLGELLAKLAPVDLVLIEGFKRTTSIKIEVYRPSLGKPLIYPADRSVVAVAVDMSVPLPTTIPTLALDDVEAIADFVVLQAMPTERQLSLSSEGMPHLRTRPRVGDGSATRTRLRGMQR